MISPTATPTRQSVERHDWIVAIVGCAAIFFGASIVFAWHAHLPTLIQLRPELAPVHYDTALCFITAGVALATHARRKHQTLRLFLAGALALIGALTLVEYAFHARWGIDRLFFRGDWLEPGSDTGRMSAVSALCLLLIGSALLLEKKKRIRPWSLIIGSLASVVIGISAIALLGYVFNLPAAYRWGQPTEIAPHAACGMGALGCALFLTAWNDGRQEGERTPRWLPIPVAFSIFTATLILYFAMESRQDGEITETVRTAVETAKSQISLRMDARIRAFERIAGRWEFSGRPTEASWEHDCNEYVHELPEIQTIEWIDPSRHTQWIVPLAGNEAKLHLDLTREPRRRSAIELARDQMQPTVTRIVSLFRDGIGLVVYVPIYVGEGQFDGWIAGVMKTQPLFDRYFPDSVLPGEAIQVSEGGLVFYERDTGAPPKHKGWSVESAMEVHGVAWNVRLWPTPQLTKHLVSPLPRVTLVGGIVCALLLGATVFLAQRSSTHARETGRALRDLTAATAEIKTLTGLLPICASCKRVRDDTGYWNQIESYLSRHSYASFSHGYCPQCAVDACHAFGIDVPPKIQAELEAQNFEA